MEDYTHYQTIDILKGMLAERTKVEYTEVRFKSNEGFASAKAFVSENSFCIIIIHRNTTKFLIMSSMKKVFFMHKLYGNICSRLSCSTTNLSAYNLDILHVHMVYTQRKGIVHKTLLLYIFSF